MTALHDVALLRLAAQRLVGRGFAEPVLTVRWLTALQAQDFPGALLSVALRTRSGRRPSTPADVRAALDSGQVVKSWPMRGTLHLVAAEDLPWMLELLAPRAVAGSTARRTGLGLTDADIGWARDLTVEALAGRRRLRRSELFAIWQDAGLSPSGQRGVHLLRVLAMTGTVVFGPTTKNEQHLVLVDEWIRSPRRLERDQALGELALRYFRSHGPATAADLARWAHLVAADVRAGIALARPSLATLDFDGTEHLMDPRTPDLLAKARAQADGVLLLPGFDELLLGYADRAAALDPSFAPLVVPGGNGMFKPTVVHAGQVVGTWARRGNSGQWTVSTTPFTAFPPEIELEVERAAIALPPALS